MIIKSDRVLDQPQWGPILLGSKKNLLLMRREQRECRESRGPSAATIIAHLLTQIVARRKCTSSSLYFFPRHPGLYRQHTTNTIFNIYTTHSLRSLIHIFFRIARGFAMRTAERPVRPVPKTSDANDSPPAQTICPKAPAQMSPTCSPHPESTYYDRLIRRRLLLVTPP